MKNNPPFTITKDSSANYKALLELERKGKIIISKVKIENEIKSVKKEYLPTAVFGNTKFGESTFGSNKQAEIFDQIKRIIGHQNIKDAIIIYTHIREDNDYCVSEDRDILSNREQLELAFPGLKIRHPDELIKEIDIKKNV